MTSREDVRGKLPLDMTGAIDAVCRRISRDALVTLARALIAQPSHTPEGETEAVEVLARFLEDEGIHCVRQQVDGWGTNLIATVPGLGSEPGLLMNGHLDTVPPSAAMRFPPYDGVIHEGQLWGRGAVDMKGGLAAMACALVALKRAGIPVQRSVTLSAVASEEQGNRGTAALVREGLPAAWAVVGEPTDLDVVIAHKGVDRYQVTVEGRAAHESLPDRGLNAITQAARIITALDNGLIPSARQQTHPLLGTATYNIGTIHGGISRNTVPDRCVFQIAKRWLPGDSPQAIRAEIESAIRASKPEAKVSVSREPEFDLIPHPPLEISADHQLTRTLRESIRRTTGRQPQVLGMAAFTDGALLQAAGIPAVIFGPGSMALAHGDDDHVALAELLTAAQVFAALAVELCGPDAAPILEVAE